MLAQLIYCYNSARFTFNKWNYHKSRLKNNERLLIQHDRPRKTKEMYWDAPFYLQPPPRSNNFWPKCNWIALRKFPALYCILTAHEFVIQAGEYTWNAPNCHWQRKGWSSDQNSNPFAVSVCYLNETGKNSDRQEFVPASISVFSCVYMRPV